MPRIEPFKTQAIVHDTLLGIWMTGRPVIAVNKHFVPVGLLHPDKTTETGLRFERRPDAIEAALTWEVSK